MPRGNPNLWRLRFAGQPWTDALIARLRRMFRAGLSDAAIASELGVTARAVTGKRQRLNLFRSERITP